jgi:COP9 signalosome complex subunit 7
MENDAKIQAFLLLGKNVKGRSCAELIAKATSEPGLYNFGELWDLPGVQDVGCGPLHAVSPLAHQLIKALSSSCSSRTASLPVT